MNKSYQLRTLLTAFVVMILTAPAIASAGSSAKGATMRVAYADLDLTRDAGVEVLYRRLKIAARSVCGPQRSIRRAGSVDRLTGNRQCYKEALAKAVSRFGNPRLIAMHKGYQSDGEFALQSGQ